MVKLAKKIYLKLHLQHKKKVLSRPKQSQCFQSLVESDEKLMDKKPITSSTQRPSAHAQTFQYEAFLGETGRGDVSTEVSFPLTQKI